MGCTRYSPLVSRFLDDDLEKEELNGFLDHLLQCEECQKELKTFETLQSCFRAADSLDPAPEPRKAFVLADLPLDAKTEPGAVPVTLLGQDALRKGAEAGGKAKKSRESSWMGNLSRYIFPQNLWQYAVPMVALILVGVWIYPGGPGDQIDVREIPASRSLSAHLAKQDPETPQMDLYLMQHVAQQPWAHYGNDTPMIQRVAGSYP